MSLVAGFCGWAWFLRCSSQEECFPLESRRWGRDEPGLMRHRWIRISVFVLGWGVLGLVLTLELYFNLRAGGMTMHGDGRGQMTVNFGEVALAQFGRTLLWAGLALPILRLRRAIPLSRGRWWGGVSFHLAASFVVMATYYLGRIFVFHRVWEEAQGGFWEIALTGFYGRNIIDMGYYWAVIAVGYNLEIYHRYKDQAIRTAQLEARLVETELKALREQLRPHFLFNTLNTISILIRENKNEAAVTLIARLGSLLRMTLDNTRVQEVTLREEVDFLGRYVDIQKARFSDRLDVAVTIEPAALEARIPHLLLQPLVENAIIHGVAPKSGLGRVDVLGRVEEGRLHLEVRDDGPGLSATVQPGREGVGLANTRERLAKLYGAEGRLTVNSVAGRGVCIQIELPFRP
ncbi:MAG: histidine kinase [Opitutaceae bacterium]